MQKERNVICKPGDGAAVGEGQAGKLYCEIQGYSKRSEEKEKNEHKQVSHKQNNGKVKLESETFFLLFKFMKNLCEKLSGKWKLDKKKKIFQLLLLLLLNTLPSPNSNLIHFNLIFNFFFSYKPINCVFFYNCDFHFSR